METAAGVALSEFLSDKVGDGNAPGEGMPTLMTSISRRLMAFTAFEAGFTRRVRMESWMLMFLYEVLHERMCVQLPLFTGSSNRTEAELQQSHNATLDLLVRHWKPHSKDIKGLRTSMKVCSRT